MSNYTSKYIFSALHGNRSDPAMSQAETPQNNYAYLPLTIFILISVIGNTLVCVAVWRDRRLQSMTNYFLFSLSIADLGVAGFVMPLALVNNFLGYWLFGQIVCNLWTTMDVTFCTSSIMHLCTIQLDRYMAIRVPVKYGEMNRSKKWITIKIFIVWFISASVGGALFVSSLIEPGNSYIPHFVYAGEMQCAIFNEMIMLYGSLAAFYIPFAIMVLLYSLTAYALRERSKRQAMTKLKLHEVSAKSGTRHVKQVDTLLSANGMASKKPLTPSSSKNSYRQDSTPSRSSNSSSAFLLGWWKQRRLASNSPSLGALNEGITLGQGSSSEEKSHLPDANGAKRIESPNGQLSVQRAGNDTNLKSCAIKTGEDVNSTASKQLSKQQKKKRDQKENERRAQLILLIVFVSFITCWFPFFAINLLFPLCFTCVQRLGLLQIIDFTTWLGYISSMLNPIIYTIFNRLFREAFWDILTCKNPADRRVTKGLRKPPGTKV